MTFLIWSMDHNAWWRPRAAGYTKKKSEAGRYTIEQALSHRLDGASEDTPEFADVLVIDED